MGTYEILQTLPLSPRAADSREIPGLSRRRCDRASCRPWFIFFVSSSFRDQGGIDTGGTIGSYIGLVCLSAVFTAIGIWCSSITTNAVVAFIAGAFACFMLYSGFGAISALPVFAGGLDYYIGMLGIDFHYRSISRGVIDTRDVLFFGSLIFLFLYLTNNFWREGRAGIAVGGTGKGRWISALVLLAAINVVAAFVHYRLDLTAERRYTLSKPTKTMLSRLDDDVQVDLYLAGNLKAGIRQLAKSAQEELQDFNEYCGGRIRLHAFDPLAKLDDSAKQVFLDSMRRMGIQPKTQVAQVEKGEEETQRIVIPGAVVRYRGRHLSGRSAERRPGAAAGTTGTIIYQCGDLTGI